MTNYVLIEKNFGNCLRINVKFDKLHLLTEKLQRENFRPYVFKRTWLEETADISLFHLQNYNCIPQGRYSSKHGELMNIYS